MDERAFYAIESCSSETDASFAFHVSSADVRSAFTPLGVHRQSPGLLSASPSASQSQPFFCGEFVSNEPGRYVEAGVGQSVFGVAHGFESRAVRGALFEDGNAPAPTPPHACSSAYDVVAAASWGFEFVSYSFVQGYSKTRKCGISVLPPKPRNAKLSGIHSEFAAPRPYGTYALRAPQPPAELPT